jgi:predicted DNA-binding protein (UPF0251 family)
MPRPKVSRRILFNPNTIYFKPRGIPLKKLEEVSLDPDECEAIRLKDFKGFDQEECSKNMEISQSTFHRIILSAREKIADAIINGKAIRIEKN